MEQGLNALRVVEAALASAREGVAIAL